MTDYALIQPVLVILAGLAVPLVIITLLSLPKGWTETPYLVPSVCIFLTLGFILCAFIFIMDSSVRGYNGGRYYTLHDDAMISMRYAWNLAHGQGLVWNPGERVEGYTNFLMVVLMALPALVLDKSMTVLVVQLFGIGTALGSAYVMLKLAGHISRNDAPEHQNFLKILVFACMLLYYPLVFWPLVGGDLGIMLFFMLLGVWAAFRYADSQARSWLVALPVALGLSYLSRPDALIAAVLVLACFWAETRATRTMVIVTLIFWAFPALHTLFRLAYYGELFPNTYILKVEGMPLEMRLADGRWFIEPFMNSAGWLLTAGALLLPVRFRPLKLLGVLVMLAMLAYQVWVGGDIGVFYWRLLALGMPLLFLFCIDALLWLALIICRALFITRVDFALILVCAAVLAGLLKLNEFYLTHNTFDYSLMNKGFNSYQVNVGLAIDELTTPEATIGVTSAGISPYYSGRYAIDFLGKSDPYIARQRPFLLSHSLGFMRNYPGHVKYDLAYSLVQRRPVFIERSAWGRQDFSMYANQVYTHVSYGGVILRLLKDSPYVYWEKLN